VAAVRAEHLDKSFGHGVTEVRALRDVSIVVEPGRVVALLGPSGSGKSTLIKALGLVSVPESGRIFFGDRLVVERGSARADVAELRRRYLGFVFQKANLISFLTARQNVQIACELGHTPAPRQRADDLLGYLGVAHRANAHPEELSGGEQQRVAIARALANHPSLVLADEPTAALDGVRGRAVMELFRKVAHEQRAAVIVVTHDHRALDVFDQIYEMEDGRLRAAGAGVGEPLGLGP
jgi:putative ABC transport system ATP-binding protein